MKKLLVIGAVLASVLVLRKKWQEAEVQKKTWHSGTDNV
ncbi:DLW-39 family protein [Arthrobacter sp. H14-L1]|nr:DLW-39 family protein [Arthrobacter sp. H14-L1]MCY0905120.1 DLW-39 family protein [Arthrobacter sp. H14-L1]